MRLFLRFSNTVIFTKSGVYCNSKSALSKGRDFREDANIGWVESLSSRWKPFKPKVLMLKAFPNFPWRWRWHRNCTYMDGKEDDGKSPFMHSSCSRTAALKWTFQLLHFSGGSETNFPHPFMGHLLSCLEKEHSKGANFQSEGSRKLASKQPHERQTFPDHSMIKPISYLTVQTFAK